MSPFRTLTLTTVASLLFIACGGGSPTPVTPAPTTAASDSASAMPSAMPSAASTDASAAPTVASAAPSASASTPPPAAWSDDLTKHQKGAFMKATFSPAMSAVFKEHDAAKYGDFGCKTCHGPDFKPNPKDFLPHLTMDGKGLAEFKTKPAVSKWMHEKVVPAAAKAFGKPEFDMKTGQGFGCMGCHAVDAKK